MTLAKLWIVFATISCFVLLTKIKGVQAQFKFRTIWRGILSGALGKSVILDCSTNDPSATVELYKGFKKLTVQPGKLTNDGGVFTIVSSTIRDSGPYRCKARNSAGIDIQKQTAVFLSSVTSPNYAHEPRVAQIKQVGESVQFTLTATVVKPTSIIWRRHFTVGGMDVNQPITAQKNISEKTLSPSSLSSTLTLINLQVDDCCHYEAVGSYQGKDHKVLFSVYVYAPRKPVITKISADSTTSESKDKKLDCVALGYPPGDLEWFKDGVKIPLCKKNCKNAHYVQSDTHKSSNKSEGTLRITTITYADAGVYKCKANNIHGSGEATTRLTVQMRPYIYKHGSNQVSKSYRRGTWATVECRVVRSEPLPTFTWLYQDFKGSAKNNDGNSCNDLVSAWLPLPSSITYDPPLNQSSSESTIKIPPNLPPVDHAACYKCQAKNQFGNDSFITELHRYKFTEKELLRIKPNKLQEVNADETLKLQCFLLLGSISPYSVRWQRNGVELDDGSDPRIKHEFIFVSNSSNIFASGKHSEITVTITNLTVNDSGLYSCKVAGDNLNKSVNIVVKAIEPPKLSWKKASTVNVTVYENNATSVKLQCVLEKGNPKPEFSWLRNNDPLHPKDSENTNCNLIRDGWYFTGNSKQDIVICGKPLNYEIFSGRYTCQAKNEEGEDAIHSVLNILAPAEVLQPVEKEPTVALGLSQSLNRTCRARGNPQPEVQWWRGSKLIKTGKGKEGVRLVIKSARESDFGNYSCVARNWHIDHRFILVQQAPDVGAGNKNGALLTTDAIIGLIVACVVFVLLVTLITYFVWHRQKKKMDLYYMRAGMTNYEIDPDRSILEQVNDMPYDPDWEFREDRLILGRTLGSGAFGQVVKAEAIGILAFNPRDKTSDAFKRRSKIRRSVRYSKMEQDPQNWKFTKTTVAVKMLKDNAGEGEYRDLASEIKIMIHIGEHQNIINILGACTQGKKLMLIMECAVHGSLLHFLRERRQVYRPTWTKTVNDPKQEYTLVDLVMAAYQISRGMEFLASKKCIHRDVAARNVLIGEGYIMKIADFGLARDIYKDDEYVKTTSGLLPVKWMALESLFDRTYTEKSDVWAFGIVLWEIFTLGGTPYPGLPTENLLDFLTEGKRMTQPENCPLEVYAIMRDCWMQEPETRPHFEQLAQHLGKILEKNFTKDNPYIIMAVEETETGNNYYLNPVDDPRLAQQKPSTSGYYETPSPLNFEPIETPKTTDEFRRYDSPLPTLPPSLPDQEPDSDMADYPLPLPPVPPTYDEALHGYENSAVREKAQLAAEEEKKIAQAAGREGSKSSADEGIGLDENGQSEVVEEEEEDEANEKSKLLLGSPATSGNPVEIRNVENGKTGFLPKQQGAKKITMESTV